MSCHSYLKIPRSGKLLLETDVFIAIYTVLSPNKGYQVEHMEGLVTCKCVTSELHWNSTNIFNLSDFSKFFMNPPPSLEQFRGSSLKNAHKSGFRHCNRLHICYQGNQVLFYHWKISNRDLQIANSYIYKQYLLVKL